MVRAAIGANVSADTVAQKFPGLKRLKPKSHLLSFDPVPRIRVVAAHPPDLGRKRENFAAVWDFITDLPVADERAPSKRPNAPDGPLAAHGSPLTSTPDAVN